MNNAKQSSLYIPGLPPRIWQQFLHQWPSAPMQTPVLPPAPAPAQKHAQPAAQDGDPIAGTWFTSGGAWHFTKDGDDYVMVETSALGQTGEGRAKLEGGNLSVNFSSTFLGQQSLTLSLDDGMVSVIGISFPFILQRA